MTDFLLAYVYLCFLYLFALKNSQVQKYVSLSFHLQNLICLSFHLRKYYLPQFSSSKILFASVFIFENMISLSFIFKFFSLLAIMISLCISYSDPSVALFYQFVPQFFGLSRKIMEDGTKVKGNNDFVDTQSCT